MARIRVVIPRGHERLLKKRALRLARQATTDQKLANTIKNRLLLPIKKKGILPDGSYVKEISDKWRRRRDRLATVNRTSRFYRGRLFSNLTFTGKFLSSFKARIKTGILRGGVTYVIEPTGDHPGYALVKGGRSPRVPMSDIAKGQISQGRDYRQLSAESKRMVTKLIVGRIRRELKLRLRI